VRDWPLVGRDAMLAALRDRVTGRTLRGCVLAGPPGSGRTTLGRACLRMATEGGADTVEVTATRSAAEVPFGAVAPLLPVPGEPQDADSIDEPVDHLRRSLAALAGRTGDRPVVVFVDDAHLLDDASATLVQQVAAADTAGIVATVRTGEPAPDPVVALWKDGITDRVELDRLGPDVVAGVLEGVLGGPVDPATVARLAELSEGNGHLMRELVTGAVDDGGLRDHGGIWRLDGTPALSARLVEIVEARLHDLDDAERALMELVANGGPVGRAELAALSDPQVAEALERRDLLASRLDGRRLRIGLSHPLDGIVLRSRTPAVRALSIAGALADSVERTGAARRDDALRIATWRLIAGAAEPRALLDGATAALRFRDLPRTEALARAAADAGGGFDADLLAARATGLQGRHDDADAELAALGGRAADEAQRSQVAVARFDTSAVWAARDGTDILAGALLTATHPTWRNRLDARRLAAVMATEGPAATAAAARPLLDRAAGDALVDACLVTAEALARTGGLDESLALSDRAAAAHRAFLDDTVLDDTVLGRPPWWDAVTRCTALLAAGRFDEASAVAGARHERALAERSDEAQAMFALLMASAAADRGHVRTAARRAREALAIHRLLDRPILVRRDVAVGALAHALAGDAGTAVELLGQLDDLSLPPAPTDDVDVLHAQAWTAAAAGDLPAARGHLEDAADRASASGDAVGEAVALHALARLGRAQQARGRLVAVAARIDGELAPARVAHAEALAAGNAAGLEAVADVFDTMGAHLLAAEAAADAAVVHRRGGAQREAAAAERRAGELAARAEDPVTPALHAVETRAVLTAAERETAVLASSGRTNKEIAEQLQLSPRTIENRLQRVYDKLGVAGRTELAEILAPET
jgi:DNA-binding CsgD family transcriptional regulator